MYTKVRNYIRKYWFIYFLNTLSNKSRTILFCFIQKILFKHSKTTYSQYCEDLFVIRHFNYKKWITYIDIGAHHPVFLSNTNKIYQEYRGHGINIEANPALMYLFHNDRKRDTNLNIGIGESWLFPFGVSTESPLSSFEPETIEVLRSSWKLKELVNIRLVELRNLWDEVTIDYNIDFLSVDVEWSNLTVLETADWNNFHPTLICVENDMSKNTKIIDFLKQKWYKKIAYNGLNTFFVIWK